MVFTVVIITVILRRHEFLQYKNEKRAGCHLAFPDRGKIASSRTGVHKSADSHPYPCLFTEAVNLPKVSVLLEDKK